MSKNANFSRISKCQWWQSVYISVILLQFLLQGYWYGLKTIQTDKNLDRYIDRLSADSRPIYRTAIFWLSTKCRPTIDWVSTNYWPIHRSSIDQLSAKCRRSVSEVSVNSRQSVGERKAILAETHLERLSTVSWLSTAISIDCQPSVDRLSTNCRPSVDWLSTKCRPLYRPISQWTLPTVNKIHVF